MTTETGVPRYAVDLDDEFKRITINEFRRLYFKEGSRPTRAQVERWIRYGTQEGRVLRGYFFDGRYYIQAKDAEAFIRGGQVKPEETPEERRAVDAWVAQFKARRAEERAERKRERELAKEKERRAAAKRREEAREAARAAKERERERARKEKAKERERARNEKAR